MPARVDREAQDLYLLTLYANRVGFGTRERKKSTEDKENTTPRHGLSRITLLWLTLQYHINPFAFYGPCRAAGRGPRARFRSITKPKSSVGNQISVRTRAALLPGARESFTCPSNDDPTDFKKLLFAIMCNIITKSGRPHRTSRLVTFTYINYIYFIHIILSDKNNNNNTQNGCFERNRF